MEIQQLRKCPKINNWLILTFLLFSKNWMLTIRHNSALLVSTRLISRSMFVDELLCFQLNFTFALMQQRTKLILDSFFCTFWIQIDGHLHHRTQSIKDLYLWWTRAVVSLRLTSGVAFDHFNKSKPSMDILFTYNQFCNTAVFSSNLLFLKAFQPAIL